MEFNLADMLESVVDVHPDRECLVVGDDRLTFSEFDKRANQLAHYLLSIGVQPGNHVGVQLYNGVEYLQTALACLKIRAVPVNVNYRYVDHELTHLYDDADLVAVVADIEFLERASTVAAKLDKLKQLIIVGDLSGADLGAVDGTAAIAFADAVKDQPQTRGFAPRSADDLYIIYTGGTTGMPKGVMWRHEDIFFAGMGGGDPAGTPAEYPEQVAEKAKDKYPLTYFPVAPLMHGAAQLASWIGMLGASKVVLVRKFDPEDVWRTASREKANSLSIVGDAMARPMAEKLAEIKEEVDLSSVFVISSAGAILSQAVRDELLANLTNTVIMDNFGASETGFQGTGVDKSSPDKKLQFTVNDRTTVLDENFKEVVPGSGTVGKVAQRKHVPVGYYKDAVKTAETFVTIDGERWVMLGDMATIEEDGTITVFGRGSVCINTGGEKVFPEEVEAGLKAHPGILDAVVTGVPDEKYGQRVVAVVQLREGHDVSEDDVIAHARTRVAGYKSPRAVLFVPSIQRSPSGKADYPWAAKLALESLV